MSFPSVETLYDVIDATWPAASSQRQNGWLIKDGQGGGKRVSSTLQVEPSAQVLNAETAMLALGQDTLFMIRKDDQALDQVLDDQGYDLIDRSVLLVAPLSALETNPEGQSHDAPNEAMKEIWREGGIGPARLAVMARAKGVKTYVAIDDKAVAYVAIHNRIAMAHAVEVSTQHRRQGLGKTIMHQIAGWAAQQGAEHLAVITVMDNIAARTLYQNLGMTEVGQYHYRIKR